MALGMGLRRAVKTAFVRFPTHPFVTRTVGIYVTYVLVGISKFNATKSPRCTNLMRVELILKNACRNKKGILDFSGN